MNKFFLRPRKTGELFGKKGDRKVKERKRKLDGKKGSGGWKS